MSQRAPSPSRLFQFHLTLAGNVGKVDHANGIIRDVAIITNGVTARGHDLEVDDTTVSQIHASAVSKVKVPVKLDHGSGITSLCGFITNFRILGGKHVGDWHLLKTHQEFETTLEKADVMPECFGLSAAFTGVPVTEVGEEVLTDEKGVQYTERAGKRFNLAAGTKKLARCTELLAVDCVTQPAANPDGLFEAKLPGVDRRGQANMNGNPADNSDPNATKEPSLAEILAAVTTLTSKVTEQGEAIAALQNGNPETDLTLDDLAAMSDDELAELEITRAEVDAEIVARDGGDGSNPGGDNTQGQPATVQGASPAVAAELSSLRQAVNYFQRKERRDNEAAAEAQLEHEFGVIEQKVAAQAQTITELRAKNEALETALKTAGSQPVKANAGEVHLFSAGNGKAPAGSYEQVVTTEFNRLKTAGETVLSAKSKAIDFGVKHNGGATYREYRERGGKLQL